MRNQVQALQGIIDARWLHMEASSRRTDEELMQDRDLFFNVTCSKVRISCGLRQGAFKS
jgi:hypothetical protein